jgi:hypothetical protein
MFSIHNQNIYLNAHLILTSLEITQRSFSESVSSSLPDEASRNWSGARADGTSLRRRIISLTRESSRSGSTSIGRRLWLRCCDIGAIAVEVGAITSIPPSWGSHDDVALRGARGPPYSVALSSRCAVAAELNVTYALSRSVDGAGESESEISACDDEVQELHVCSCVK